MNYDENKKTRYGGTYACLRHGAALCNNAHTFSWRDAFTHAYSCFANGILMWTSFRIADWFYHAFTSLCSFWYASILSMSMAFELATYGFVSGFIYHRWKTQNLKKVYLTLLVSMLLGRISWGITRVVMLGMMKTPFSWQIFIADGFIRAIPAIILQLILIPFILDRLNKAHILPYK